MISKISKLFIWWIRLLELKFIQNFGNFVGSEYVNNYFKSSDGTKDGLIIRFVIPLVYHRAQIGYTNIPINSFIRKKIVYQRNIEDNYIKIEKSKKYHPNNFKNHSIFNDYESWKPKN